MFRNLMISHWYEIVLLIVAVPITLTACLFFVLSAYVAVTLFKDAFEAKSKR